MPTRTSRLVVTLVAAALIFAAVPAAVFAQSAGDQQYADPFGDSGSGSDGNAGSGGGSQGTSGAGTSAPTAGAQAQPAAGTTTPPQQTTTTPRAAQSANELPRTGYSVWLAAVAGGVLLASGTTMRLSLGRRA